MAMESQRIVVDNKHTTKRSKRRVVNKKARNNSFDKYHLIQASKPICETQNTRKFYNHVTNMMRLLKKPNRPQATLKQAIPKQRNKNKAVKRLNQEIVNLQHVKNHETPVKANSTSCFHHETTVKANNTLDFHDKFTNSFQPVSKKHVRKEQKISSQIKTKVQAEDQITKAPFSFKFLKSSKKITKY